MRAVLRTTADVLIVAALAGLFFVGVGYFAVLTAACLIGAYLIFRP